MKNIWAASNNGLYILDKKLNQFVIFKNRIPTEEFQFLKYLIWSAPGKGIHLYNCKQGHEYVITPSASHAAETWYSDKNETFWFGSILETTKEGTGLNQAIFLNKSFNNISLTEDKSGLKKALPYSVTKDKNNNVWVACRGISELFCLTPDGNIKKFIIPDKTVNEFQIAPRTIVYDSSGNLFLGYMENMLFKYSFKTNKIIQISALPEFKKKASFLKSFKQIFLLKSNEIIVGGNEGFIIINRENFEIKFTYQFKVRHFYSLYLDSKNDLWIGNGGTLLRFRENMGKPETIVLFYDKYNIESIVEGDSNYLWLALYMGGIARFDRKTYAVKVFSVRNGLNNNTTYEILKDTRGDLWISTNIGLSKFNPRTFQFWNFGVDDGLLVKHFTYDAACVSQDGEMIFGGFGGIVRFHPETVQNLRKEVFPTLLLTEFKVSGILQYFDSALYAKKHIVLNKGSDNFSASFACLDFRNSEKLHYRYCLQGYSNDWILSDSKQRFVNFANLKPGHYTLHIEVSDISGKWGQRATIPITIPSFYYQTSWVKFSAGTFVFIILASIILFYIHQIRLSERKKQEFLKLESLRHQLNPHFIFNALNPLNFFISKLDKIAANQYLTDFSNLMRSFLNNSKHEYIPLEDEIETLKQYLLLQKSRYNERFDYRIDITTELIDQGIEVAPSMVQPFVENAIVHGFSRMAEKRQGFVSIFFSRKVDGTIRCVVEDDGVGRKKATGGLPNEKRGHQSRGISIISERLRLYSKINKTDFRMIIEDAFPEREEPGTRVIIPIPVNKRT